MGKNESNVKPAIEFNAEVIRVQTMANNALRIILEMPEQNIPEFAMLAECKRNGIYLHIRAEAAR